MTPNLNHIYQGDTLDILRGWPDSFIDMVITSPPYFGLRRYLSEDHPDYKKQIGLEETFEIYQERLLAVIAEIKRVLKPTGSFWLNLGDCYGGSMQGYGAKEKSKTGIQTPAGIDERYANKKPVLANENQKCLMMMPERIALKMIDEQGWILRNKIRWAKQVYLKKEGRTVGSVMPTSVKDRFNESGEELYFFVKNKKYYSDLDAVRLPNQVLGVTDFRQDDHHIGSGFVRTPDLYPNSKYRGKFRGNENAESFNSPRARTQRYGKGSEYEQKYGEPWDRFGKNTKKAGNKVNDPRGNHEGGPGSWRDFKDNPENSFPKFQAKQSELRSKFDPRPKTGAGSLGYGKEVMDYYKDCDVKGNINGKNLPTIWQIGSEPHNFSRECGVDTDHFASFPQALVEIPVLFGSPEGGIILDPFMGSGTVALVAARYGRKFLGIEISEAYIKIAEARLKAEMAQGKLL